MTMPNYTIRSLDQRDEPFLWDMLYQALYVPEGQEPFPKDIVYQPDIAKYVSEWGKDGDKGCIAVDESSLQSMGAGWVRLFTKENKGYGYVDDEIPELSIAILPAYRNQGIGTKLLNALINDASRRHQALSLSVSVDNPAVRLYERLGFETVDQNGASMKMVKILSQI